MWCVALGALKERKKTATIIAAAAVSQSPMSIASGSMPSYDIERFYGLYRASSRGKGLYNCHPTPKAHVSRSFLTRVLRGTALSAQLPVLWEHTRGVRCSVRDRKLYVDDIY